MQKSCQAATPSSNQICSTILACHPYDCATLWLGFGVSLCAYTLWRYTVTVYAMALYVYVCLSQVKSSVETAKQIDLYFWHGGFPQLTMHCVITKFKYIYK